MILMLDALKFVRTPAAVMSAFSDCLWKIKTTEKVIYLTFDDGPVDGVTDFVLDELQRWNAHATFFCIGKNVEASPSLFARITAEGHRLGNHTYAHLNGWSMESNHYFESVRQCDQAMGFNTEASRPLFRPPYGKLTLPQYQHLRGRYQIVMWEVLTYDFDLAATEEQVYRNAVDHAGPGSIIVFHDSLKAAPKMKAVLPRVLEHFTNEGFRFETL